MSPEIRKYIYKLDDIYNHHRRENGNDFAVYFPKIINHYCRYWRDLEDNEFNGLEDRQADEIYFFLDQQLRKIAFTHLDFYWPIVSFDGQFLYRNGRQPKPFWRAQGIRKRKKGYFRKRAKPNT